MPVSSCRCVLIDVMSGTVLRLRSGGLITRNRSTVPDITASNTHLQEDTGIT